MLSSFAISPALVSAFVSLGSRVNSFRRNTVVHSLASQYPTAWFALIQFRIYSDHGIHGFITMIESSSRLGRKIHINCSITIISAHGFMMSLLVQLIWILGGFWWMVSILRAFETDHRGIPEMGWQMFWDLFEGILLAVIEMISTMWYAPIRVVSASVVVCTSIRHRSSTMNWATAFSSFLSTRSSGIWE